MNKEYSTSLFQLLSFMCIMTICGIRNTVKFITIPFIFINDIKLQALELIKVCVRNVLCYWGINQCCGISKEKLHLPYILMDSLKIKQSKAMSQREQYIICAQRTNNNSFILLPAKWRSRPEIIEPWQQLGASSQPLTWPKSNTFGV